MHSNTDINIRPPPGSPLEKRCWSTWMSRPAHSHGPHSHMPAAAWSTFISALAQCGCRVPCAVCHVACGVCRRPCGMWRVACGVWLADVRLVRSLRRASLSQSYPQDRRPSLTDEPSPEKLVRRPSLTEGRSVRPSLGRVEGRALRVAGRAQGAALPEPDFVPYLSPVTLALALRA